MPDRTACDGRTARRTTMMGTNAARRRRRTHEEDERDRGDKTVSESREGVARAGMAPDCGGPRRDYCRLHHLQRYVCMYVWRRGRYCRCSFFFPPPIIGSVAVCPPHWPPSSKATSQTTNRDHVGGGRGGWTPSCGAASVTRWL